MTPQQKKEQFEAIIDRIDNIIAEGVEDGFQMTVAVGGISFSYASLAELLKTRDKYVGELAAVEAKINGVRGRYRLPLVMP
jgi:nucleoside permease NupC